MWNFVLHYSLPAAIIVWLSTFFDQIFRGLKILEQVCVFSDVEVVRSVAHYAVLYERNHSFLGRNLLFCMSMSGYNCTAQVQCSYTHSYCMMF